MKRINTGQFVGNSRVIGTMDKIRVMQMIPIFNPGGAERVATHLACTLDRNRFDVAFLSLHKPVGTDLETWLKAEGVPIYYLGKWRGFDPRTYFKVWRAFRHYKPHVLHTHLTVIRYALLPALICRIPVIVHTVHNLAEKEIKLRPARWFQQLAYRWGVQPVAIADEVFVTLKQVYGLENCPLIPNGIPVREYSQPEVGREEWRARNGFNPEQVLIVCVAGFRAQKNHRLLLEAFAQAFRENQKVQLLLIGDGDLKEPCREQAKSSGIESQVHFMGWRYDVPNILGACDLFALSSDYEGNPLSVMEAMSAGLPVVSTGVGGVPELVEDGKTGWIVPPGDAPALARALRSLVQNEERRQRIGKTALQVALERFDVSLMVRDYEKLYLDLLNKRQETPVAS